MRSALACSLQAGFRVATAINGLDGLVKALSLRPDVIVMDLAMPDLDGLDCTRQLAYSADTREIPVIVLTAHATPEAREHGHGRRLPRLPGQAVRGFGL